MISYANWINVMALVAIFFAGCGDEGQDEGSKASPGESAVRSEVPSDGWDTPSDAEDVPLPPQSPPAPESPRYLYVASGACYTGGVAAIAGSSTIAAFDLAKQSLNRIVLDYNSFGLGDSPVGMVQRSDKKFLVAVENTAGRRLDLVDYQGQSFSTFLVSAGFTGVLRGLKIFSDGGIVVPRSTGVEKFSYNKARITQGANAYIQAPAAPCATSTTMITDVAEHTAGLIVYTHAAASPNNKIGVISAGGYASAPDCRSAQAAPLATSLPTAVVVHSSGDMLVAYAGTALASNSIYSYKVDPATGVISSPIAAFNNPVSIYGVSAMSLDGDDLYVANGAATYNTIEKFRYTPATQTLTKVGMGSFIEPSLYTRCISSLLVGE